MLSGNEVHVLDKNSEYQGIPTNQLMEQAGNGVADFISTKLSSKIKKIFVVCGPGNNGGDGLVAARYLSENYQVSVFLPVEKMKTSLAQKNLDKVQKCKVTIYFKNDLKEFDEIVAGYDVIVDSMLGIGLSGTLKEPFLSIVHKINTIKDIIIIAVDVPTGLGTDTAILPDYTVTFHDLKENMNSKNCGRIHTVDIGIPEKAVQYVGPGELSVYYPRPQQDSHKGDNGKVLVVGGGPYIGAPALSGLAALRTGADLVYIACPRRAAQSITAISSMMKSTTGCWLFRLN